MCTMVTQPLVYVWVIVVAFIRVSLQCCVPVQFQCSMDVTGGYTQPGSLTPIYVDNKVRLYYDYTINATRTDADVTLPDGSTFVHSEITFYSKHISYIIDGSRCQVKHIKDMMQERCIPDYAKVISKGNIKGLGINTWHYFSPSSNLTTVRSVTTGDCLPVVQMQHGIYINGGYSEMTYLMYNILEGERPGHIAVPDFCHA